MKFEEKPSPRPSNPPGHPTPQPPVHVPLRKDSPSPSRGVPRVPSPSPDPKK